MIYTCLRHLLWESKWSFKFWSSPFLLFLSSRLPSGRIPSCWMDGTLPKKLLKKVVMERLRRGQVVNFWLINFWSSKGTFCCMYIMAALFQKFKQSLKFDHSAKVHCVQGLSFITKIHLKICVELRCGRSQALHCVGRLITLLQEASFFGDS